MATATLVTRVVGLAACQGERPGAEPSPDRPAIVVLLLDDVRYDDLGWGNDPAHGRDLFDQGLPGDDKTRSA